MTSWLARLLGRSQDAVPPGIYLAQPTCWEISPPRDRAAFIRHLPMILPEASTLYLEAPGMARKVVAFLQPRQVANPIQVARGTIWPKPRIFHIAMTPENVEGLAQLFERHIWPEVCHHFHAYSEGRVMLHWHDAFCSYPLFVSAAIAEDKVRSFAAALECSYRIHRSSG